MMSNVDRQDFGGSAVVEALDHAVGLRWVGAGPTSIDDLNLAGFLERVGREA